MARPRKNPLTVDKVCEGCQKPFTISYRKKHQRFCNKSCAQNTPSVIDKMKKSQLQTFQKNYGVDHPMKTKEVVKNFKQSMVDKYGVDSALKKEEFVTKSFNTKLKKYGNENYNNIEKIKQTCLKKYGVDNILKYKPLIANTNSERMDKNYQKIQEACIKNDLTPLFSRKEYKGYHFSFQYQFKCNKCNNEFYDTVYTINGFYCNKCNPDIRFKLESSFFSWLCSVVNNSHEIKRKDRTVLNGKELDFYIPSLKLAFELNGLYWHSESARGITKLYHLNKTKSCLFHEVKLIHIFENEWLYKMEIIQSIVKSLLNKTSDKIYARQCVIKEVLTKNCINFLDKNHLQGKDKSAIKLGLYYNDELVSVMTFCKSRFDKKIEWEMSRYCNKLNTSVVGGASKLFSHFIKTYNPNSVVSYNDRRFFNGEVYSTLGFNFIKNTTPNYYYVIDKYKNLVNRMNFQKHRLSKLLPDFDPNLTEWENMKNHGFDRIWDCGNGKWVWRKPV